MLFNKPPTTNPDAVQAAGVKGSHPAEAFKATTLSSEKKCHFVALCLDPAWVTAVLEQVGDERKDPVKEPSEQSPFRDVHLNSCCLLTTHWCRLHAPRWRWFLLTFLTYSSKTAVHNRSSTGFSNAATTGALCVLERVWMFEVYHWQAESRWQKQAFSDGKGTINRGEILCQHVYFQSHGFNRGKYCSPDNLEHITPSKEACTFVSITMINISNKKNASPLNYATWK